MQSEVDNYRAAMVLAAVGDAMGYKNGDWQFLTNSAILHKQMMQLTQDKGPLYLNITMAWKYSDDTVMHIATALGLLRCQKKSEISEVCHCIAQQYKKCWGRMAGRAPGNTTGKSIQILAADGSNWNKIPYNERAYGCGGSMRSACIGLAYPDNINMLVAVSIEAGRITHHNPVGYLGSLIAAYFTGLAVRRVQPLLWLAYFLEQAEPLAISYIKEAGREVQLNIERDSWGKFVTAVREYAKKRNLSCQINEVKQPCFPKEYGVVEREHFYKSLSWSGWPGALGIDSVLIAYDAFLSSAGSWEQLCLRAILHGGDNDSTGTIAGAWFGAFYGFKCVPKNHYQHLEDGKKLAIIGENLFAWK